MREFPSYSQSPKEDDERPSWLSAHQWQKYRAHTTYLQLFNKYQAAKDKLKKQDQYIERLKEERDAAQRATNDAKAALAGKRLIQANLAALNALSCA